MTRNALESIHKELLDLHAAVQNLSAREVLDGSADSFGDFGKRLHALARLEIDNHEVEILLRHPQIRSAVQHIISLKRVHSLRMEIETARSVLASRHPWNEIRRFHTYPNYVQLAGMERSGANLGIGDCVVFLGSGPLPLTLIVLAKQYGVRGIGIEQVPAYTGMSSKLIRVLELNESIRILSGNHYLLPLREPCRLIMVGADARPRSEIFAHLAHSLPPGSRVSYRIYEKGLRRILEEPTPFDIPSEFRECLRIRPTPPVNNTSVFLIKKNE